MNRFVCLFFKKAWHWSEAGNYRSAVIEVLEEMGKAFGADFSPYITNLCPYLLDLVHNDRTKERRLTLLSLECIRSIVDSIGAHIHLILPPVLYALDDKQIPDRIRSTALETLITICCHHAILDHGPTIIQTWCRAITTKCLHERLMNLLFILIQQVFFAIR